MSREQLVLEEGRVGGRSAGGVELEGNGVVVEKVLLTQLEVAAEELADETVGWCGRSGVGGSFGEWVWEWFC